jgi:hypothetical protein
VDAVVADVLVGFCEVELNVFTPVHENVPPVTFAALNVKVAPSHIGVLLVMIGADGITLTVALIVEEGLVHPRTVTVAL